MNPSVTCDPPPSGTNLYAASRSRRWLASFAAVIALAAALICSVAMGPEGVNVRVSSVPVIIAGQLPGLKRLVRDNASEEDRAIVWELRLPRALAAALIGALLGYAGVALQGLLMNPLADPYTVGVSAGAAVGMAFAEVSRLALLWAGMGGVGIAFVAALGAVALVYTLARVRGRVSAQTFLLAGVVVSTMLWSMIPLLMTLARRMNDLERIFFYLIGNLQQADWQKVWLLAPFVLLSAIFLRLWARDLNLMTLGEESAAHLGVEIETFKRKVLLLGALATAAAVSVSGIIGFVGLVVPHLARRIVGPDHRALLPLAALLGALLLVVSDTIVRVYLNDLPVGVITAIIGAPFFCMLLRRRRAVAW